jgi:hypothetical protein
VYAIGQGQIHVAIHNGLANRHTILKDVLYCPQIGTNLLSVTHLTKCGSDIRFTSEICQIYSPEGDLIGLAPLSDGLYRLKCTILGVEQVYITRYEEGENVKATQLARTTTASATMAVWHSRLGHISDQSIMKIVRSGMAEGMDVEENKTPTDYCDECEATARSQFPILEETLTRSNEPLGRLFSHVCQVNHVSREGYSHFITFVDDHSRFTTIYPIKKESDTLEVFKEFLAEAEQQSGNRLKILRTDGGGEYSSPEFTDYLKEASIVHEKTGPNTPQEHCVAECVTWTLATMTMAMLVGAKSPGGRTAWPYAIRHAAHIKNIIPHPALPDGTSPYELWTGNKPSVATIRIFGCKATATVPSKCREKLARRSISGIHLGLAMGKKAFLVYDPNTRRIHESQDVHFVEESNEWEHVMIERPKVESWVVQRDSDAGEDEENWMDGRNGMDIVESGEEMDMDMQESNGDGIRDEEMEQKEMNEPRRSGRTRRPRMRDDDDRFFASSYNRIRQVPRSARLS